jgi:hypothetical protein
VKYDTRSSFALNIKLRPYTAAATGPKLQLVEDQGTKVRRCRLTLSILG